MKKKYDVGNSKEDIKGPLAENINAILKDEFALFSKTLNFHWNLQGPRFHSLHEFFGQQYQTLLVCMDQTAERIRMFGAFPISPNTHSDRQNSISTANHTHPSESQMIEELTEGHHLICGEIKTLLKEKKYFEEDPGTEDFLTNLLQTHEKEVWMLKSHLQ